MSFLNVSENDLPKNYENKVIENNENYVIIRCNLQNVHDINNWVVEFGELTHTKWNSRNTRPEGRRFICWKQFVCHRSNYKKGTRTKSANCEATIKIKVKINNSKTRYTDPYLKLGLSAVIFMRKLHSHTLITRDALRLLPPNEALKAKFFMYFDNGMGVAESCKYHRKILELQEISELELSNGRINPTERTARYWYDLWKQLNLEPGNGFNLLQKLQEKQATYADLGITMLINETPILVVLVTPLMQRTHELKSSQNIVFVESTSACDTENHNVTFILTSCPAGTSPLGVIITKGQSYESYQTGFKLLNGAVKNSFGGQGFPNIFITDNSKDKINAVKSVWPNSKNFYSIFHVCQTVWKWLSDMKNCIPKEEISSLMRAFQRILFSNTMEEATDAFQNLYYSAIPYPNFQKYISDYWESKELWCLAWRDGTLQEHYMNHFSELCIHIFRDVVLSRVKIHKVIALVDFCCTVLDNYYCQKFQLFANNRTSSIKIFFNSLLKETMNLDSKDIVCNGDEFYVPNENKSEVYIVIAKTALCSCLEGQSGKFCEHQCVVYKFFDVVTEISPLITVEDRYNVAILAMGEEVPLKSFYHPHMLTQNNEKYSIPENHLDNFENIADETVTSTEETSVYDDESIEDILDMIIACHTKFGSSSVGIKKLAESLQEIKSAEQWEIFLHMAGSKIPLSGKDNG